MADTVAYTRVDRFRISGTAKRAGRISLTEALIVSPDCSTLTMTYSIRGRDGRDANSVAVFRRELDDEVDV